MAPMWPHRLLFDRRFVKTVMLATGASVIATSTLMVLLGETTHFAVLLDIANLAVLNALVALFALPAVLIVAAAVCSAVHAFVSLWVGRPHFAAAIGAGVGVAAGHAAFAACVLLVDRQPDEAGVWLAATTVSITPLAAAVAGPVAWLEFKSDDRFSIGDGGRVG